MGIITSKEETRYWTKKEISFLRKNQFMRRTEIAHKLQRNHSGVCAKMKALKLLRRKCDSAKLTFYQEQLIYGSLLGDGTIALGKEDKYPRFSEGHSIKQKDYLMFKYKKLKPFSGKFIQYKTKWGGEVKFSTCNHITFLEFRSMFYDSSGKKRITKATLARISSPVALAMWFGDDGNREKDSYRLATGAYTIQELTLMITWLYKDFGIRAHKHKHGAYCYLSIRGKDRFVLTNIIKPYLPKSMHYKLLE